ncbi:DUF4229 domain-containing protein [Williamsia sp. M5A3_1d]
MNERDTSASQPGPAGAPTGPNQPGAGRGLATALILYTVARLGLVIVLAALIYGIGHLAGVDVPILVAAIFAVVTALPLGMLLFKRLRTDVNSAIAAVDADRRAKRDALQARLQGSQRPDGSGDPQS